ncbi:MAG: transcriptional regulator [Cytophagaceae bacterium]|mgnify:CR=1 FL=1|nr:transcriptional regulator [Cytophagaceae bacterium]|tara:strand:- start:1262 stop:1822 length:561 start_codon:yes stop_codon:yes gene_type:complete
MDTSRPTKGNLLIAEPSIIGDVSFNRSVVLLANHTHEGSVGFILNKPLSFTLSELIPEVKSTMKIFNGGPVEQDNLYFIHKVPELIPDSVEISAGIYWGGNFNKVIELLAQNKIREDEIRFFLGYSGWDSNQLDDELDSRSWIIAENTYEKEIISKCLPEFWKEKMVELGGDYLIWSNAPENPAYN